MPVRIIFHEFPSHDRTLVESPRAQGKASPQGRASPEKIRRQRKEQMARSSHRSEGAYEGAPAWAAGTRASEARSVTAGGSGGEDVASHGGISVEIRTPRSLRRASQEPTDTGVSSDHGAVTPGESLSPDLAQRTAPVSLRRSSRSAQEALAAPSGVIQAQLDRSLLSAAEGGAAAVPDTPPTRRPQRRASPPPLGS